ncbi:MAG TPA: peptidase MA family metallohydrolase [candidate division Zixibacteria bacterium]|nr:peptidase MA family metallohydrolase [candidate division Zixibacteria bacterium]
MGRLTPAGPMLRMRPIRLVAAAALVLTLLAPAPAAAFTGFGHMQADATYGEGMTFSVELDGGAPDRLELLIEFSGDEGTFVAPVTPDGDRASYTWDAGDRHLPPNTRLTYRWRATDGDEVTLSSARELVYDDDRPGLDWQSRQMGEATVHWYGGAEAQARRFGELSVDAVEAAEQLLGHELVAPVDIFVYDSQEDFFGALGPGAREWTGAATYPNLRTIFMWLQGGAGDFLETTLVHEVTHVVFADATDNPFHEPAKWLNEGIASWSERRSADAERNLVEFEADGAGLFAFEAISEEFPIGERAARLSYAQGATMVDMIVDRYGPQAIAGMAAAYREGASDAEALEAGTGRPADELFADFYAEFGVEAPQPVEPEPIPPSNVRLPGGGPVDEPPDDEPASPAATPEPAPGRVGDQAFPWAAVVEAVVVGVAVIGAATVFAVRRVRGTRHEPREEPW